MIKFVLTCSRLRGVCCARTPRRRRRLSPSNSPIFFWLDFIIFFISIHFIHGVSRLLNSPAATRLITHFFHSKEWKKEKNLKNTSSTTYILFRLFDRPSMQHSLTHTHTPHSFDSENEEKSIPFDGAYECCVLCFQPRQWKIHLYSLSTAVLCTQKEKKWKENHLNSETRKEIMIKKVYIQRGSFLNRLHSHNQKQCVHKSNQNEMNKKKHTFIKSKVDFSVRLKA